MSAEGEIVTGTIVQLKSDGPKMTVAKIESYNSQPVATCEWFTKDGTPHSKDYPVVALKVYVAPPPVKLSDIQKAKMEREY